MQWNSPVFSGISFLTKDINKEDNLLFPKFLVFTFHFLQSQVRGVVLCLITVNVDYTHCFFLFSFVSYRGVQHVLHFSSWLFPEAINFSFFLASDTDKLLRLAFFCLHLHEYRHIFTIYTHSDAYTLKNY